MNEDLVTPIISADKQSSLVLARWPVRLDEFDGSSDYLNVNTWI